MSHAVKDAVKDAVSDTGSVDTSSARPFTSWRGALEWWYRPVVTAEAWIALAYLAVGALWALAMLVVTVGIVSVTFGLLFVFVGVFLIVPTFALVGAMTGVECSRAGWIDEPIVPRPVRASPPNSTPRPLDPLGHVGAHRPGTVAVDRVRRGASRSAAPLLFGLALTPWIIVLTLVLGNVADLASVDLLAVAVGVALAGAAPRVTLAVAHVARSFVAWFLGPDPTAELQGRVQELAGQRTLILEAVGAERRRIERDLHDGVQQQLVALGIDIGRARSRIDDDPAAARRLLDDALTKVRGAVGELRVIGRGIAPGRARRSWPRRGAVLGRRSRVDSDQRRRRPRHGTSG